MLVGGADAVSEASVNGRQQRAVAGLERAFAACAAAGIVIVAMDTNLLAYDGREYDARRAAGHDPYTTQIALGQGDLVNTHGVHRDSGGW